MYNTYDKLEKKLELMYNTIKDVLYMKSEKKVSEYGIKVKRNLSR